MKIASLVSISIATAIKFFYLSLKRRLLRNCITQVERDWKAVKDPGYRATMLRQTSINRHLITISALMFYSSGMFLRIAVPISAKMPVKRNATVKPAALLGYDFLLNFEFSYADDFVLSVQLIRGLIKCSVTTWTSRQSSRLDDYVTDLQGKRRDPLGFIIRDHVAVLGLSSDMQESMSEIYLVQIVVATLLICLIAYYFLVVKLSIYQYPFKFED
ncbi:uncharacterized protein LOC143373196 [Andrena cerasifolii]|uniref:uncharacterized protein LOC143373196 n=1 Tax=Andrena cerasifolii TaxID=2819439 RepID=UPI004037F283